MRAEGLSRLQQSFQSRENSRPPIRILSIRRVVLRPVIVRYYNLHRSSGVGSTFTLDITAPSPMPNLYSNSFGGSARGTSPVTYRIGFPSVLGPGQVIAPPGFRSNSKSAPMKIFRFASFETNPSQTFSTGAAM